MRLSNFEDEENDIPPYPKKAKSGWDYFLAENRKDFKDEHPELKPSQVTAKLGEIWRTETPEKEKKKYEKKAVKDKKRYQSERDTYMSWKENPIHDESSSSSSYEEEKSSSSDTEEVDEWDTSDKEISSSTQSNGKEEESDTIEDYVLSRKGKQEQEFSSSDEEMDAYDSDNEEKPTVSYKVYL